jgi:hypothetical protein
MDVDSMRIGLMFHGFLYEGVHCFVILDVPVRRQYGLYMRNRIVGHGGAYAVKTKPSMLPLSRQFCTSFSKASQPGP